MQLMIQPTMSGRLTKKFFLSIPEGHYLASGVGQAPGQPDFAETVLPLAEREEQWRRILKARVNGRNCDVFRSPFEHFDFCLSIRSTIKRN
jgi:hypothetical protein